MKKFLSAFLALIIFVGMILPFSFNVTAESNIIRYTVLVLDTSGPMDFLNENNEVFYTADTAITYVKQAALKFLDDILNADGTNYVAIISFKSTATVVSDFTYNSSSLKDSIDGLYSGGERNIAAGLSEADILLSDIYDAPNVKKNVVLFTTGMTNDGSYSYSGRYGESTVGSNWNRIDTGIKLYAYANNAISAADELKKQSTIYTLGLFRTFDDMPDYGRQVVEFFKLTAKDLATSESHFYQVNDPNEIEFAFGDIADDISTRDIPVIVVPGVMGSNLYSSPDCNDDSLVWLPDYQNFSGFDYLQLVGWGDRMDISQVLYVREPENLVKSVDREYGARDEYKSLVDNLCDYFPNGEVYFFSYDWRLSNVTNGENLNDFIESLNVEKVNLVCHSMGGLVASCYVASHGTDGINKIITCGTPYEGAPSMVNKLQNWDLLNDNKDFSLSDLKDDISDSFLGFFGLMNKSFKKNLPAIGELFPTKDYVDTTPMYEDSWIPANFGDKAITTERYVKICNKILAKNSFSNAEATHNFITSNNGNYCVLADFEEAYFIVGTGVPTISSIKFQFLGNDIDETIYESELNYTTQGDGTVPYLSATMNGYLIGKQHLITLPNTNHGGTAYGEDGIKTILNILLNNEISQEPVLEKEYMVIRIACPVDFSIECDGKVLSSTDENFNVNSGWGRVDFLGTDDEIKMICIDNTDLYDILLKGTDTGTMDYTISWYNHNNELTSTETFTDVNITDKTIINTTTSVDNIVLNVDSDGDGVVDNVIVPDVSDGEHTVDSDLEVLESDKDREYDETDASKSGVTNMLPVIIAIIAIILIIAAIIIIVLLRKK